MENEQKTQTIETLRQTIKEWDISWRIGETVSRIKIDTYNWTGIPYIERAFLIKT